MSHSEPNLSAKTGGCCGGEHHSPSVLPQKNILEQLGISLAGLPQRWWLHLMLGIVFFSAGLFLRQVDDHLLFTGWKSWVQPILGLLAAYQFNKALGLQLPPWLAAVETVAIMMPLIVPTESAFSMQALKNFIVIAPVVALFAQSLSVITPRASEILDQKWNIPPWVTQLAVYVVSILLGAYIMPILFKPLVALGWFDENSKAGMLAMAQVCPRGCSVGLGGFCVTQAVEAMGAIYSGVKVQENDRP